MMNTRLRNKRELSFTDETFRKKQLQNEYLNQAKYNQNYVKMVDEDRHMDFGLFDYRKRARDMVRRTNTQEGQIE